MCDENEIEEFMHQANKMSAREYAEKLLVIKGGKIYFPELSNFQAHSVGVNCVIHSHVWVGDRVAIGDRCKIQAFSFIPNGVRIGNDVFIGPHVTFTNDKYPPSGGEWFITIVNDHVVIGAGAVILPGVTLGKGCRIGGGAVVTKNVEPYTTVVGNPARQFP